jgi:hypothetical protein
MNTCCSNGKAQHWQNCKSSGYLVAKAAAAAVDHDAHLTDLLDAHLAGGCRIKDLVYHLDFCVMVARAQCPHLLTRTTVSQRARVCRSSLSSLLCMPSYGLITRTVVLCTWGRPRFFALWLTAVGSACSMRPYSSQCSLSSAQEYPWQERIRQSLNTPSRASSSKAANATHQAGRSSCTSLIGPHGSSAPHLTQRPVHAHLERGLQIARRGGDDALAAHAHWDVVKQRLRQLLLDICDIRLHLHQGPCWQTCTWPRVNIASTDELVDW